MSAKLREELEFNFEQFEQQWPKELGDAQAALVASRKHFIQSYVAISSVQAWRSAVILGNVSEGAEAFFFEAQNDLLISHCLSRCGSFRQALKALRGAIENIYFSLYYKDHSVELKKWEAGRYRVSFSELTSYFESHPALCEHELALQGVASLKEEYATLSKAVHGSAVAFRMTQNLHEIRLWGGDQGSVGKWATRERHVVTSVNLIMAHLFADKLQGASNRNLRQMVGLVTSKAHQKVLKEKLKITIPAA
jgi:hypothetical protein